MSWVVTLCFIDQVKRKIHKYQQRFFPLYTYHKLYHNLDTFMKNIGWDQINYKTTAIDFKLASYKDEPVVVSDWDKLILNKDVIHIVLYDPNVYFYSLFSQHGEVLKSDKSIKSIYQSLNSFKDCEFLFIYLINEPKTKAKLIDVIYNTQVSYNQTVNKLVHNYYEKFKITL